MKFAERIDKLQPYLFVGNQQEDKPEEGGRR